MVMENMKPRNREKVPKRMTVPALVAQVALGSAPTVSEHCWTWAKVLRQPSAAARVATGMTTLWTTAAA